MANNEVDPFDGYQPPAPAGQIKLNAVGDGFGLRVEEVSQPFEAEYGDVFTVSGTLVALLGNAEGPEIGEEASFMMAWEKKDGKPAHVREELAKATKAAGRRSGATVPGDLIYVKRDRDDTHSKGGKKFANPFRHHIVLVKELADDGQAADPWADAPL